MGNDKINGVPVEKVDSLDGATIDMEALEDSVNLKIDDSGNDKTPGNKSIGERAKDAFNNFVVGTNPDDNNTAGSKRGRGRPSGSKTATTNKSSGPGVFVSQAPTVALGVIFIMGRLCPPYWAATYKLPDSDPFTLLPSHKQAQSMVTPLLRIVDRHTRIKEVSPDGEDLALCIGAITAYAIENRVHARMILMAMAKDKEDNERQQNNTGQVRSFSNGIVSNGPPTS